MRETAAPCEQEDTGQFRTTAEQVPQRRQRCEPRQSLADHSYVDVGAKSYRNGEKAPWSVSECDVLSPDQTFGMRIVETENPGWIEIGPDLSHRQRAQIHKTDD